jgi:hypothetical protein
MVGVFISPSMADPSKAIVVPRPLFPDRLKVKRRGSTLHTAKRIQVMIAPGRPTEFIGQKVLTAMFYIVHMFFEGHNVCRIAA